MSTTARIGVLFPNTTPNGAIETPVDGTVKSVYLHFDGYPDRVLPLLNKNYSTLKKAQSLLDGGDMSVLGESLNTCVFYHRDEKEPYDDTCYMEDKNLSAYRNYDRVDYTYLYTPGGVWTVLNEDEG